MIDDECMDEWMNANACGCKQRPVRAALRPSKASSAACCTLHARRRILGGCALASKIHPYSPSLPLVRTFDSNAHLVVLERLHSSLSQLDNMHQTYHYSLPVFNTKITVVLALLSGIPSTAPQTTIIMHPCSTANNHYYHF
jgi:hypothetical protein